MTTLKEILDAESALWHEDEGEWQKFIAAIESWAYGQEKSCSDCDHGQQRDPEGGLYYICSTCYGTGTIREPGLVERVEARIESALAAEQRVTYPAALREELGEP